MVISLIFCGENFQYSDVIFSFNFQCASISYTPSCSPKYSDNGPVYHLSGITRFLAKSCFKIGSFLYFFVEICQYSNVSIYFVFQCASINYTPSGSPTYINYGPVYQLSGITRFLLICCFKCGHIFDFLR